MNYIYIGKIVNTHGIKGEIRLLSDFEKKNLVFKKDFIIYIGREKAKEIINSYRVHKNFDMITLKGINDINEVLKYKGSKVYANREDLGLEQDDFLLDDLIGMKIVSHEVEYGEVLSINKMSCNTLLYVKSDKCYYIPYVSEYIKKVDLKNGCIEVERVEDFYEI